VSFGCRVVISSQLTSSISYFHFHKVKIFLLYLWFSVLGYIVIVFHFELFLCLHVRLICALNYYLLTFGLRSFSTAGPTVWNCLRVGRGPGPSMSWAGLVGWAF